jgi:CheY-like chemotaxis protein
VLNGCVLVVDDDELVRDMLVELIKIHGCPAKAAANGFEALKVLLTTDDVCLIFLDLAMPVMDGAAFREEQLDRENLRDIPVVLMSAFERLSNRTKQLQVDVYLQKPLTESEVVEVVRRYCRCSAGKA